MPNKTIYVADIDLPVFERAQELAGENLSATIAQALRHFIETEEARTRGYGEITLKVGKQMTYTYKQFLGRELARHRLRDQETGRMLTQTVFQTAKGRLVLYTRAHPDWGSWGDFGDWTDWASSFDLDWDWDKNWNMNFSFGPGPSAKGDSPEAREARARFKEAARARREEWRERRRQAKEAAKAAGKSDSSRWGDGGNYDMEVYESLDDLKPHISEDFYAAVARALRGEDVEFLDI